MSKYYLKKDHTYIPCSLRRWSDQLEYMHRTNTKHVARDEVNGRLISTVWIGLDHSFQLNSEHPLVFETMIFDDITTGDELYMERYTTWQEAEEGHKKAIEWVKANYPQTITAE